MKAKSLILNSLNSTSKNLIKYKKEVKSTKKCMLCQRFFDEYFGEIGYISDDTTYVPVAIEDEGQVLSKKEKWTYNYIVICPTCFRKIQSYIETLKVDGEDGQECSET